MRHLNLAAAVLLGVGILTTRTSAQQAQTPTEAPRADGQVQQMLSRRARAALEKALQARESATGFQFKGDVDHLRTPVDCGMPVMTGDPAIDPQFSKQPQAPPGGRFKHTIKVIPVQPCR